jgi:hypothetical protein
MSIQKLYLPVGYSAKPYPVPTFKLVIPWLGTCSERVNKPVTITWDSSKTTIESSSLVINATTSEDPVGLRIYFNDEEVRQFIWSEGDKGEVKSDIIDVPIVNGVNKVGAYSCRQYMPFPWIGVVNVNVDTYVLVTFTGETPQRPWDEVVWEWIMANWPWVTVGAGALIIGGVAYSYLESPKSR